jgi:hypothetical protein
MRRTTPPGSSISAISAVCEGIGGAVGHVDVGEELGKDFDKRDHVLIMP